MGRGRLVEHALARGAPSVRHGRGGKHRACGGSRRRATTGHRLRGACRCRRSVPELRCGAYTLCSGGAARAVPSVRAASFGGCRVACAAGGSCACLDACMRAGNRTRGAGVPGSCVHADRCAARPHCTGENGRGNRCCCRCYRVEVCCWRGMRPQMLHVAGVTAAFCAAECRAEPGAYPA